MNDTDNRDYLQVRKNIAMPTERTEMIMIIIKVLVLGLLFTSIR